MSTAGRDFGGALQLPDIIEIEPTDTCNLRCRACHVSFMQHERPRLLDVELMRKLKPLGPRYAIVGSVFEPTVHPGIYDILDSLTEQGCRIEMLTNGTMFDAAGVRALAAANMYYISFSFDGIRRETFESIRRRARYDEVIERIRAVRTAFAGRDTFFNLNYTVMRRNLDEIAEATDFWDEQGFDAMNFIFMVVRELEPELIQESLYPIRERAYRAFDDLAAHVIETRKRITVRAPYYRTTPLRRVYPRHFDDVVVRSDHPSARIVPIPRNDMQLRPFPGMPFPCGSPFTLARILANGDVQLCYRYVVGNLHERSFADIWYGERADRVRRTLMADTCTCRGCDYHRFALKYNEMDLDDPTLYFSANTVDYVTAVDFEQGVVLVPVRPAPPRLVESIGAHNVVYFDRRYFGIPQSAGPLSVDSDDVAAVPGVVIDKSLATVRAAVRRIETGGDRNDSVHEAER